MIATTREYVVSLCIKTHKEFPLALWLGGQTPQKPPRKRAVFGKPQGGKMANLTAISTETLEDALTECNNKLMSYQSPEAKERTLARIGEIEAELYKRSPDYR